MKAVDIDLRQDYAGTWWMAFALEKQSVPDAKRLMDTSKGKLLDVNAEPHRERRSKTANAYFHHLCNKLARVLRVSDDGCKKMLVCRYGTIAQVDGEEIVVRVPKGGDVEAIYPYVRWMYEDAEGEVYAMYKPTHSLNSKEFAQLIDGTVDECKAVGIETLPREELERLYAQADARNSDTEKRQGQGV